MRVSGFLICMHATQEQQLNTKKFPWPGHESWLMKSAAASKDPLDVSNGSMYDAIIPCCVPTEDRWSWGTSEASPSASLLYSQRLSVDPALYWANISLR